MITYVGTFIRNRRCELRMSQQELADAIGVPRSRVYRWETGDLPVARERVPRLAEALRIGEKVMREVIESSLPRVTSTLLPAEVAPLAPIECTLEQMCEKVPGASHVCDLTREKLGSVPFAEMETMFLRQTPWELHGGHVILLDTATLAWTSPLVAGSRKPIFGEDGLYQGHLLRLAIVWERDRVRDVFFPQVPIRVVGERREEMYRVDYLIVHSSPRRPSVTLGLEFDGGPHEFQKAKDAERSARLPFPVIRFDNAIVRAPQFLPRLFDQIREKARWSEANDQSYHNFLGDRRQRFERLKDAG